MSGGNNYTLRFVSVSSTGGSPSIGNLLDYISISSLSCTSAPASSVVSLQTLPDPVVAVTDATCTVSTGILEVTPPGTSTYEYSLDTDPYQLGTTFNGVAVGTHTITVHDLTSGCYSLPFSVTIVAPTVVNPVLGFSYTSPVCKNGAATLSPTLVPGFTIGGTFSSTTGLTINGSTGVIDIANSTPGTYTITYQSVGVNTATTCLVSGTDTATITINPVITLGTSFSYNTPFCASTGTESPTLGTGFSPGGTFSSTNGLIINPSTGDIDLTSTPGTYTITYTITPNVSNCEVATPGTTQIMIISPVTIDLTGGCQGQTYILTASPIAGSFDPNTATYAWHDADGAFVGSTQSITVSAVGTYTVTVTVNGCDSVSLPFNVDSVFCIIQKGISVNNDGLNDTFDLTGFDVKKLTIFNRLGMKVYSRSGYVNEWGGKSDDGDELPDGTYYYIIDRNTGDTKTGWIYINRAQ